MDLATVASENRIDSVLILFSVCNEVIRWRSSFYPPFIGGCVCGSVTTPGSAVGRTKVALRICIQLAGVFAVPCYVPRCLLGLRSHGFAQ